ncbi:MAG: hypothetical protein HKN35_13385 [Woeseia sp.]|nr:hypothetical protein [Woeseia sp.]
MEIAINDGAGDDVVIRIDSKEDGFNLQEMQLGASHALNTVDGRPVVVTRVEDGYQFDVDGRQISMPLMEHGQTEHDQAASKHKEVRIIRHMAGGPDGHAEGVTIISPTPLDGATRASISATLAAAGESKVHFINFDKVASVSQMPASEDEEVRIIRKEVRVTN